MKKDKFLRVLKELLPDDKEIMFATKDKNKLSIKWEETKSIKKKSKE